MPRTRTPEYKLTPEQLKKRLYNERYRARMNEKSIEKKSLKLKENSALLRVEKKTIYAKAGNDSVGSFSNDGIESSQTNFSNVLIFPTREREGDFSNNSVESFVVFCSCDLFCDHAQGLHQDGNCEPHGPNGSDND